MFHLCEQSWNFARARTLCGFSCVTKNETTMCIATDVLLDAKCCHFTKTYFVQYFWAIKLHQRTLVIARGFCFLRWFRSCVFSREVTSAKLCLHIMLELLPTHDSHQDKLFSSLQSLLLCWCDTDLKGTEIVKDFRTKNYFSIFDWKPKLDRMFPNFKNISALTDSLKNPKSLFFWNEMMVNVAAFNVWRRAIVNLDY